MIPRPINPYDILKGDRILWYSADDVRVWTAEFDSPPHLGWGEHVLLERSGESGGGRTLIDASVFTVPGRGTSYTSTYGGHEVEVYVTEKLKKIRVFVDHKEWKP